MKSRRPALDFTGIPAAWTPDAGFAGFLNAGGALAPAVEPYLNRVMSEAARQLGPEHTALGTDIRDLVRQETEHFKLHAAFNQALHDQGFAGLAPVVDALKLELAAQFRDRSFAYNLAWCVGFETYTLLLGQYLFGPGALLFEGADPRAVELWRWHLAEEYEHRAVCHDAYRALIGDYPLRVATTLRVHFHMGRWRDRALAVLAPDPSGRRRVARFTRGVSLRIGPRLLPTLLPYYDPAGAPPPPGVAEALALHPEAA